MKRLSLSHLSPVAGGVDREIYRHPSDPMALVKVVRNANDRDEFIAARAWYSKLFYRLNVRRYRHLIGFLRELREQIAVAANGENHLVFLQRVMGLVYTDLGAGLVVVAEYGRDGKLALTLADLIRSGTFDAPAEAAFERFIDQLMASDVIVEDINPRNLVYAYSAEAGDHFVLIDGIGFKTLLPLERLHRALNRWSKRSKIKALRARVARDLRLRQERLTRPRAS
jgi:hypothetical protein